jgi:hypothetical protein
LEDWERGFWRVDLSSWPEDEKVEFWRKLRKTIESGRFGWIYVLFDVYPPFPPPPTTTAFFSLPKWAHLSTWKSSFSISSSVRTDEEGV